ncbi:efflux RND transporter periplasmic adaptor subunit [Ovoidimarina sediminis]|uniref:efflux RND transporter periplasmic adaptor subunit n=1 Tax=Ovoidimarina sediminis TaxID=3079856 RepID=UPI00290E1EAB|nr:efflux RND transporter periplasmic adaptor subunit [Rhodophyticola sp. MJ-SS7]MDU8943230.1 efflux RND transporter periplasmic adaptor subunit [Rhodophyticola sp. MJ-SS7]
MRPVSILTAVAVVAVLYLLVFERERLISFATGDATVEMAAEAPAADAPVVPKKEVTSEMTPVHVVAKRSEADTINNAVILRGRTEASRQVDVRAEVSGLVISDPLRRGARIEAGDLLCELDIGTRDSELAEAQARLAEAQARLADAEINERAAARLSQDGFASETRLTAAQAAVQSARASVQSAQAGIAAAEKELDRLEIRAPFGGLLESDTAEIGSFLQPGALCATVIELDPIKLVGFVPETEVDKVVVGAMAGARLASGREVQGQVTFLSRSADPNTRTFRVDVTVENADGAIRDGQTAEIFIAADGALAHLIPQSALTLNNDGRLGVRLVAADNRAAFAPISILRDTVDGVWVSGLENEVSLIVVGQEFVTDGVPVLPSYEDEAAQ